jgi:hypothetical protein
MLNIKQMTCVVCNHGAPSDCHHITDCGRRLGHEFTIPLCYDCHRGDNGFSGKKRSAWDKSLENQMRLLEITNKRLGVK